MNRPYRVDPEQDYLYFITSAIVRWIPIFLSIPYFSIMADSLAHCRRTKGLLLHGYVFMPNHFHLIASAENRKDLPDIVRDFKRYTSRAITRQLQSDNHRLYIELLRAHRCPRTGNTEFKVWRDGYHPIYIRSDWFFRSKLNYIHNNPVKKGYVRRPQDWLYSSADTYITGRPGPVGIDPVRLF